jgi:hypothetical protein
MSIHQKLGKAALQRRPPKHPRKPSSQALGARHLHRKTAPVGCLCLVPDPEPLVAEWVPSTRSASSAPAVAATAAPRTRRYRPKTGRTIYSAR